MREKIIKNIILYAETMPDFRSTVQAVLEGIQKYTEFDSVGIRIKNTIGDQ